MKRDSRKIVAKMDRLCRSLDKFESVPEKYGCSTIIRKASKMFTVGKCLVDFLILLDKLKNYFNFYQQSFYGREYSS